MLSIDVIRAAQSAPILSDRLAAERAVIDATESRVQSLALKAAQRMAPHGGARFANYADEFAQAGRVAVWECLKRFSDDTAEAFMRYTYTTVEGALKDAVRNERNVRAGADADALKVYAAMVAAADGDMWAAAKMAQTVPPKGQRLSAERAEAARLAWLGDVSLDGKWDGARGEGEGALVDTVAASVEPEEIDGEIRPKVGHGAALEALAVLQRYCAVGVSRMTPGEFAANLPALVDALEDSVVVPRDPAERRYVLDAMAVLRSAVSTATEGALIEELRDVRDERQSESREKHERVHAVLESMGAGQRAVLKHSFGIDGFTDYGWGDGCDMAGLCNELSLTPVNLRQARTLGRKSFAKRYVAAVALESPHFAAVLAAAAAANRTHGGRK